MTDVDVSLFPKCEFQSMDIDLSDTDYYIACLALQNKRNTKDSL